MDRAFYRSTSLSAKQQPTRQIHVDMKPTGYVCGGSYIEVGPRRFKIPAEFDELVGTMEEGQNIFTETLLQRGPNEKRKNCQWWVKPYYESRAKTFKFDSGEDLLVIEHFAFTEPIYSWRMPVIGPAVGPLYLKTSKIVLLWKEDDRIAYWSTKDSQNNDWKTYMELIRANGLPPLLFSRVYRA